MIAVTAVAALSSMASSTSPALTPFLGAIEQDVGDRSAALASRPEGRKRWVPNRLAGFERPNLPQSDPLFVCHRGASHMSAC
jgi:hypothetical protein